MSETGRVLKPANENPWYVLMTLYGEQDGEEVDEALHEKNRAVWNAWSCQGMTVEERAKAAESSKVTAAELAAWPEIQAEVLRLHEGEMRRRAGSGFAFPGLPQPDALVDLFEVEFDHHLMMANAVFNGDVHFDSARFSGEAWFRSATFSGYAGFRRATFNGDALFSTATFIGSAGFDFVMFKGEAKFRSATFSDDAWFKYATFVGDVAFRLAVFSEEALFDSAKFCSEARFHFAKFSKGAGFDSAMFSGFAYFPEVGFGTQGEDRTVSFADCQFQKPTSFRGAIFHSCYPEFAGALLHDKTAFTATPDHWPQGTQPNPEQAKASCAAIRHNLGKQGLPEDEHFFFRREMGFTLEIERGWRRVPYWFFKVFSDFGESIERPVTALCWLWFVPMLIYVAFAVTGQVCDDLEVLLRSAALSVANLFPLFGFQRIWFDPAGLAALSPWLKALGGLQTVASLPLLFFLGLGLRTRFRMR